MSLNCLTAQLNILGNFNYLIHYSYVHWCIKQHYFSSDLIPHLDFTGTRTLKSVSRVYSEVLNIIWQRQLDPSTEKNGFDETFKSEIQNSIYCA